MCTRKIIWITFDNAPIAYEDAHQIDSIVSKVITDKGNGHFNCVRTVHVSEDTYICQGTKICGEPTCHLKLIRISYISKDRSFLGVHYRDIARLMRLMPDILEELNLDKKTKCHILDKSYDEFEAPDDAF